MTIDSNNNPINYIVGQTVSVMSMDAEKKAEWFELVRKFQNAQDFQNDDDFQELLHSIIFLLLGDHPLKIKINPQNKFSDSWQEILTKMKLADAFSLAQDDIKQVADPLELARISAFSNLTYQELLIDNYDAIYANLSTDEIDMLQTLVLWDGPFGPSHCEQLGINKTLLDTLIKRKVITAVVDIENDPWFNIPLQLRELIITSLSVEQIRDNHKKIARYLRKWFLELYDKHSVRSAPLELIRNIDGSPVDKEGLDFIEGILLGSFFEIMLFQSEDLPKAQYIGRTLERLITHQLGCSEYWDAFFNAQLLSKAYVQWGKVEEGKRILSNVIDKWQQADPEQAAQTINQYEGEKSTRVQSKNPASKGNIEENEKMINELHRKNDLSGLAKKYYEISEKNYDYPTEGLQKALDSNFLAELYAKKCKDFLLLANIFHLRGRIYTAGNFFDESLDALHKALDTFRQTNTLPGVMYTQLSFALVFFQNDMFVETIASSKEALDLAMKYNDLQSFTQASFLMAKALLAIGETELALQLFQKILVETANDSDNSYFAMRQEVLAEIQKYHPHKPE